MNKLNLWWIAGVILLLAGLAAIGQGGFISAIFYIIGGLICIPPTFKIVEERINFQVPNWQKIVVIIGALIIAGFFMPKIDDVSDLPKTSANSTSQPSDAQSGALNNQQIDKNELERLEAERLTEQLKSEISKFDKPFDNSSYKGSKDAVQMEVVLFSFWAQIVKEGEVSSNPEDQKLAKVLKSKVVALQIKEFPKMRKEITKVLRDKLWEENIEVACIGSGNSTLDFIGASFASNKIIKKTQEVLEETLITYRFKRTQYRWIPSATEYTYYSVESPNDTELITF